MHTCNSMIECDRMFLADFLVLDKMVADKLRLESEAYEKMISQ